jgi:hypothetical protein
MTIAKVLAIGAGLLFASAAGALADQPADRGSTPGLGWGKGGKVDAVPGPVAGLGIPIVLAAGGYAWFVARRRAGRQDSTRDK